MQKAEADEQEKFEETKQKFDDAKVKLVNTMNDRNKELEDQGQWKTFWEEANKTIKKMQQQNECVKTTV